MRSIRRAVNRAPIVAVLRAAAALPNSGLSQQLDFHELGWLRPPLRRRRCASVGGEERKSPIFAKLPSPVTGRGADESWIEGIASDADPFLAVFCRLERQTINRILSMRRQISKASVLIYTEVVEHPAATDNFRLPDWIVGRRFDLHSHKELFRRIGVVEIATPR